MDDDPLSSPYTSLDSYCPDLTVLHDHACRGAWISLLHKIPHQKVASSTSKPHHHLVYLTYHLLSLFKLRRFNDANTLLVNALQQNNAVDLDSAHFRFESFPVQYPDHSLGSMIPFALRWLHALLPSTVGNSKLTLDRFYSLLHFVRTKKQNAVTDGDRDNQSDESNAGLKSLDLWKKRELHVINTIVGLHLNAKEFKVCLDLLNYVVKENGDGDPDPFVLSKLGYVKMMCGDLSGAKLCFDSVEKISLKIGVNDDKEIIDVDLRNLVGRNRALVYLVEKDYASAVREYDNCVERDGKDAVALNNKALCLMYMRDLSDAIKVLEGALERVPTVALDETVVVNLCSMYELAYVNHGDVKKTLSNWIGRVAPDDFDSSCTRI